VIDSSSDYRPGNSGGSWERRSWKMFWLLERIFNFLWQKILKFL
jgi:hypothetical protein